MNLLRYSGRLPRSCLPSKRSFTVLAIESSADDTGVAIVTSSRQILSNVVKKQHTVHEKFGGIHPREAVYAHQENIGHAVREALADANMQAHEVDGIAFTRGPGMPGCLGVGSSAARTLAAALNKPLVGVHHMQAHALTALLTSTPESRPTFPFLTLLVSGGHTLLLLAISQTSFRILATTSDASIGRVIDKVSRMLKLPWSSSFGPGAALEDFCRPVSEGESVEFDVPAFSKAVPGVMAFSFSGLHSAVERYITTKGIDNLNLGTRRAVAREFQRAAVAQLEDKIALGLNYCQREGIDIRHLVVSGGVASNAFLRERLQICVSNASTASPISLVFPPPSLCTDNAVMIAWASMYRFLAGDFDDYSILISPEWSIENLDSP
ncbi:glycoprotease [Amylostereum chailletii]|nr:glycoprotease [Amylostereum chailletii]